MNERSFFHSHYLIYCLDSIWSLLDPREKNNVYLLKNENSVSKMVLTVGMKKFALCKWDANSSSDQIFFFFLEKLTQKFTEKYESGLTQISIYWKKIILLFDFEISFEHTTSTDLSRKRKIHIFLTGKKMKRISWSFTVDMLSIKQWIQLNKCNSTMNS